MRIIEERWEGIGWRIEQGQKQAVTPEGSPLQKPDGSPEMVPVLVMTFMHQTPELTHLIHVPFDDDQKQKLIQALTSGVIVVAGPGDVPKLH